MFSAKARNTGCWIWDKRVTNIYKDLKKTLINQVLLTFLYDSLLALKSVIANVVGL